MPTGPLLGAALALLVAGTGSSGLESAGPRATGFAATNGAKAFAGDHRLLTTISPNGDGYRDQARISFRLSAPAFVRFTIAAARPDSRIVHSVVGRRRAGRTSFVWAPPRRTASGTYVARVSLRGHPGRVSAAPVIRVQHLDVGAERDSYAPGSLARFRVATDALSLSLRVYRIGRPVKGRGATPLDHSPVSDVLTLDWRRMRHAARRVGVVLGPWPSGLYFLKVVTDDGRVGYAPFVVRPRQLGEHRVAVVLPTNTWHAYNFYDADGDGAGDSWYVAWKQRTVRVDRPHLDLSEPVRVGRFDLAFFRWLALEDHAVDVLAQRDLERARSGAELERAYALLVFPGHHEYVTAREHDLVTRYRNLGGNLLFLSSNNFFRRVLRRARTLVWTRNWRELGRPEAALVGVAYRRGDRGGRRAPYVVRNVAAAPWLFSGTGLTVGSRFGRYGIEIDSTTSASPPRTRVLAEIPHLFGRGHTAQMTYYEARGAKVFAAGAMSLARRALAEPDSKLLANLWAALSEP